MNEKIPLRALADRVAETTGRGSEETETLIKRLFELIAETLHEGRKVEVKGLGTFSLSDNPADPVEFSPADAWAERINAPFAMFEPEELAEEATESDFNDILPDTSASVTTEQYIEETPLHVYAATEEVLTEEPLPQAVTDTEITAAETVAAGELQPVISEEPTGTDGTGAEEDITVQTKIIAETESDSTPLLIDAEERAGTDETVSNDSQQPTAEACPAEIVCLTDEPDTTESEDTHEEPMASTDDADAGSDNGFGKGFIVGLIVGLAIGALALCCYVMYFVHNSGQPQTVETELIEDSPVIAE